MSDEAAPLQRLDPTGDIGGSDDGDEPYLDERESDPCVIESDKPVLLEVPALSGMADAPMSDGAIDVRLTNLFGRPVTVELWAITTADGVLRQSDKMTAALAVDEVRTLAVTAFASPATQLADLEYAANVRIHGRVFDGDRLVLGLSYNEIWAMTTPGIGPVYCNLEALKTLHAQGDLTGKHVGKDVGDGAIARAVKLEPGVYYGDPEDPKE